MGISLFGTNLYFVMALAYFLVFFAFLFLGVLLEKPEERDWRDFIYKFFWLAVILLIAAAFVERWS